MDPAATTAAQPSAAAIGAGGPGVLPALPELPAGGASEGDQDARRRRRRRTHLQILGGIGLSYLTDAMLLGVLAACGSLAASIAISYAAWACVHVGTFYIVYRQDLSDRLKDHFAALPQIVLSSAICLGHAWIAPGIGVLLISVLFVILAFASLWLPARSAGVTTLLVAVAVCAYVVTAGERVAMPTATLAERLVCGLWLSLVLVRLALIGRYGLRVREMLHQKNLALKKSVAMIERMASHDSLTGALARATVLGAVETEARTMDERGGRGFSIALVDLDHFKQVNDSYGHQVGDQVLAAVADTVQQAIRPFDRFGRYGGEEFLLLMPGLEDPVMAFVVADRIRRTVHHADWKRFDESLRVSVSMGLVTRLPGESLLSLVNRADVELYRAKSGGRNRVSQG